LVPLTLTIPGVTSNIPTAYGTDKGSVGLGFGYQERTRYTKNDDGALALVVGLGKPEKLGLDLQFTALDLSQFGDRASLSVKAHRLLPKDWAVAIGCENLAVRGFADSGRSFYAVTTKKLRLKEDSTQSFSRLYFSAGLGNGRFRPEHIVARDSGSINVFGSAAINFNSSSTVFTEWTGQSLNVGVSLVPFKKLPLVITPALADVAGPAGDGTRFTLGIGYVLR